MGLEEHKYGEWLESEKCIQGMHTKYKYMEVQVGVANSQIHKCTKHTIFIILSR